MPGSPKVTVWTSLAELPWPSELVSSSVTRALSVNVLPPSSDAGRGGHEPEVVVAPHGVRDPSVGGLGDGRRRAGLMRRRRRADGQDVGARVPPVDRIGQVTLDHPEADLAARDADHANVVRRRKHERRAQDVDVRVRLGPQDRGRPTGQQVSPRDDQGARPDPADSQLVFVRGQDDRDVRRGDARVVGQVAAVAIGPDLPGAARVARLRDGQVQEVGAEVPVVADQHPHPARVDRIPQDPRVAAVLEDRQPEERPDRHASAGSCRRGR